MIENTNQPLNRILYGPPGTGKTYNTINEALKIIDPEFYNQNREDDKRQLLRDRYNELLITDWNNPNGRIAFCTFHQSMSYEDFVEGIKPILPDKEMKELESSLKIPKTTIEYRREDGIFKLISDKAAGNQSIVAEIELGGTINEEDFNTYSFYKLSLGNTYIASDNEIYEYCINNNVISLGYGGECNFTDIHKEDEFDKFCKDNDIIEYSKQAIHYFKFRMDKGDYVLISNGNYNVRAIGRITGNYEYRENSPISYNQFRTVEWIKKNVSIPIGDINKKVLSQQTIYKLDKANLKKDFFTKPMASTSKIDSTLTNNYVLIIDEINRGNISQIFGELITLIEKDKRAGGDESLSVTLPYSKESFSVPSNLYIIGTMNTADRSVEALDTALRRRFDFIEMAPKPEKLDGSEIDGINLRKLLETINGRIELLLDTDHLIGHSYFMNMDGAAGLQNAFQNKIIPLLQEYFYGDYGKIGLVIGEKFFDDKKRKFEFSKFPYDGKDELKDRTIYHLKNISSMKPAEFSEAVKEIFQEA
jgi:5-methylcytosine-specific restriction protein B